jgi:hypothetical protein
MTRKDFLQQSGMMAASLSGAALPAAAARDAVPGAAAPHFACGCRVGEVSSRAAIIWTRLTAERERRWGGVVPTPLMSPPRTISNSPAIPTTEWEGAVPGVSGQVRIRLGLELVFPDNATTTPWMSVTPDTDCSARFTLAELQPGTRWKNILV